MDLTIFLGSIMICQVLSYEFMPNNIGTVLFTANDCSKKNWDKDDLALIQARMYAQQLIPPINTGVIVNEKYIKTMMSYFREIFRTIKFESRDERVGEILTAATCDSLGGYLKSWMLPITKFAFYGGTVNKETAQRMLSFYNDIRHFLGTDGSPWRGPDVEDLRYVSVNIASPPAVTTIRFMTDPCKKIAFFEKTDNGLKIPIPTITWHDTGAMLFLPMKKQPIICLNSQTSTNALFQYYDAAKRCAKAANGFNEADFDLRMETWLINNVLPHLNDENLYYGLNSVLTLINKTNELCDKMVNLYVNRNTQTSQPLKSTSYGNYMSKKVIIITVILFLEICWCIPAMFYMKFSKNKKKPRSKENFLSVCVSYGDKSIKDISLIDEVKRIRHKDDHGVKFKGHHRIKNKHSSSQKKYVYNNPTRPSKRTNQIFEDEAPLICPSDDVYHHTRNKAEFLKMKPYCISNASVDTTSSGLTRQKNLDKTKEHESTKTVTLFTNAEPRKHFKEQHGKVQTTKSHQSQVTILKDLPIVFQDPSQSSSIISTKITKIIIARDEREEKGKFFNTHKQIKSHSHDKGYYKQNAIILTRKGTKSNVEKQFGIKIERQENDFSSFNSNEKNTCSKSSKGISDCPKLSIKEINSEPDNLAAKSNKSSTHKEIRENQNSPAPVVPRKSSQNLDKKSEVDSTVVFPKNTTADDGSKSSTAI